MTDGFHGFKRPEKQFSDADTSAGRELAAVSRECHERGRGDFGGLSDGGSMASVNLDRHAG